MNYIDNRTPNIRDIQSVYSNDISEFICGIADIPELQRIASVSKNDGTELSNFNTFQYRYSRLDHSFNVATILEHFGAKKINIIEAMLHEMAKPSFSFSEKYLKNYFKMTDFVTPSLFDKLVASEGMFNKISKGEISVNDITGFKGYSLGFANYPKLSADTLEYVLSNGYFTKICELREIEDLYNNVIILKNENGEDEFGFLDFADAKKFFKLSIEVGKKKRSYEAKITKQLISDVLMLMMRREEIDLIDLYKFSDKAIMEIGKNCSDKRIKEGWQMIENLDTVYTKFNPTENPEKYCVKVNERSIYVDPLVKTKAGNFRLSSIDASCEKEIEIYKESDTDLYMYIDYEL